MKEMEMEAQRRKLLQIKKAQEEMKKQEEVKKRENMERKVRYNVQDGSATKERFRERETIRGQERPNTQIQGNQHQFGNTIMPQQRGDERKFGNLPSEEIDWKDKTQKGEYGNVRFKNEENQE